MGNSERVLGGRLGALWRGALAFVRRGCIFCPPGQHKVNATKCEPCYAGKFLKSGKDNDRTACQECEIGRYQSEQGQTACVQCPAGQYQDETDQSACKECPTGKFKPVPGTHDCQECPEGQVRWMDPYGTYAAGPDPHFSSRPTPLIQTHTSHHPHLHSHLTLHSHPRPITAPQYQDETGQEGCKRCAPGDYQIELGKSVCSRVQTPTHT